MRGRPPLGAQLVERLAGSPQAKQRLAIILRTLAGELTIPQACAELNIGESRFHDLRTQILQHTLEDLEPRPLGRPAQHPSEQEAGTAQLRQEVQQLKTDLHAAQIQQELTLMLPRLGRHKPEANAPGGKKRHCRRSGH